MSSFIIPRRLRKITNSCHGLKFSKKDYRSGAAPKLSPYDVSFKKKF